MPRRAPLLLSVPDRLSTFKGVGGWSNAVHCANDPPARSSIPFSSLASSIKAARAPSDGFAQTSRGIVVMNNAGVSSWSARAWLPSAARPGEAMDSVVIPSSTSMLSFAPKKRWLAMCRPPQLDSTVFKISEDRHRTHVRGWLLALQHGQSNTGAILCVSLLQPVTFRGP